MALGDDVRPDYRALPRATYTDPEAASVGLTLEQATGRRARRLRVRRRLRDDVKGYAVEAELGHVTIVVDRATPRADRRGDGLPRRVSRDPRVRPGDPGAGPDRVLADTIHAFPSTSRILNGLFAEAAKDLAPRLTRLVARV